MKQFNKIVILQKTGIEEFALEDLKKLSNEVILYETAPQSNEEIVKRCADADCVLITFSSHLEAEVINQLPHLKHIGLCCSLYDDESANVDLATCRKNNISVSGVSVYGDDGVIEFVFSELSRLLLGTGENMFFNEPNELKSLKLGIVGLGSLGSKIAEFATFFEMDVYYNGRSKKDVPYTYLEINDLVTKCDVISLHLPRNVIALSQEQFDIMDDSKIVIDTGLGYSFDKESFDDWIVHPNHYGIFDAASIDRNFQEKHKDNSRVIINKRVSGFTKNARERLAGHVLNNLKEFLKK